MPEKQSKDGSEVYQMSDLEDVMVLTDLDQVRVLADPLRVRILESLCLEELTTKQVAEKLGEKPTRLYHHVEALEKVGLIRLTRTQQNRGTVEKYFRSVARTFRADSGLFSTEGDPGKADTLVEMVNSMMTRTTGELEQLLRAGYDISSGEEALVSFTEVRADDDAAEKIRKKLMAAMKDIEALCCDEAPREGLRRYRFNLAYFPLDLSERSEED
jgi:DNA-binding transcriptional ArsR family regulator